MIPLTLGEIAQKIEGTIIGDANKIISRIASLDTATSAEISFLSARSYLPQLQISQAGAMILSQQDRDQYEGDKILVLDVYLAFAKVSRLFHPSLPIKPNVHSSVTISATARVDSRVEIAANVVIEEGVKIAENVFIGPGCVIGAQCVLNEGTRLVANVTVLNKSIIGKNCILHAGCVIGDEGFGFAPENGQWLKIPQTGKVILGDNVEIGSNTTVDRGTLGDTIIGDGVKIDNQVQIGHNVKIGAYTAIAASAAIAGSAEIGVHCTIAGLAGVAGHLKIADEVNVLAMSMVSKSILKSGTYAASWPAQENKTWKNTVAKVRRLVKQKTKK